MDNTTAPAAPQAPPRVLDFDADLGRIMRHPSGAAGWLLQHRNGDLQAELTEALAQLLLACAENEKPGEITLRIRVSPNPDDPAQVIVSDQVALKLPPRATSVAYVFDQDAMRISAEQHGQLSIPLSA